MLYNGYGEHNIQGIGDKHIPLIHNVTNSDDAVAITDQATDNLLLLFNTDAGKSLLRAKGVDPALVDQLCHLGFSSIANMLAAIKVATYHSLGSDDVIITVATDGMEMYRSEIEKITARDHDGRFDSRAATTTHTRFLEDADTGDFLHLGPAERRRIFNLGYYTWVEQQGVDVDTFEARRDQSWWHALRPFTTHWDEMIASFNERTGVSVRPSRAANIRR